MRTWQLTTNDPLVLTLAADARLAKTDYLNDQIWELTLGKGSPPALAVQTTFGLRARMMRMFPRFHEGDEAIIDPNHFVRQPVVQACLPNYLQLTGAPLEDIELSMEYWVPISQAICGRVSIKNESDRDRQIRIEWIGQLTPTEGQRLSPVEIQGVSVLTGQTANLFPLIFLTKGPKFGSGSYPCLSLSFDLAPDDKKEFYWVHAALETQEASFALARSLATSRWEAEKARMEMQNAGQLEIYTGNPDWDACLMLTQKTALSLFQSTNSKLPYPSIVHNRQPDQGFSLRGDGSDYSHLWSGQSILDVYSLSQLLSASAPELIQGLLENFLAIQDENGFIDWKPGLAGQRSRLLATPLLSSLYLEMAEVLDQPDSLKQAYPRLLAFFDQWFSASIDRDQDGIPEWSHPMQYDYEDHPIYSPWNSWSQGILVSTTESPALCAFLFKECLSLIKIGEKIGDETRKSELEMIAARLAQSVENSWDEARQAYRDWDRDTHSTPEGGLLAQTSGPGLILLQRPFEQPVRLVFHIHPGKQNRPNPMIYIHGANPAGKHRVEPISGEKFRGSSERICHTTESVFSAIEQIELRHLDPSDQVSIYLSGFPYLDQSVFTPLWAGLPTLERANDLIQKNLLNPDRFWRPHGIPSCLDSPAEPEARVYRGGSLFWNQIIGEGLLAYGYRERAAELVSRLMDNAIQTLRTESSFRQFIDVQSGQVWGESNTLSGLAPLGLFMETLGIRLFSHQRLMVSGFNPFPWPITVKYRGIQILCEKDRATIAFPNGQSLEITDPNPRIISLENLPGK